MSDVEVRLDGNVLDGIATLICGDDTDYYRAGYQIAKFFRAAGWRDVDECEGYRRTWAREQLEQRRDDSDALRGVLLRLADPREYLDDERSRAEVIIELNRLLAFEGLHVFYERGRPVLSQEVTAANRITMEQPAELKASLAEIVNDARFGDQLQGRLDEAYVCWHAGAPTAAIIMLGSLLEGVLYDVASSQRRDGKEPADFLAPLLKLAHAQGWIAREVFEYSEVLRGHRNLVHPRRQLVDSYAPDADIARIAWNVVVAALNDLAALPPPTP
ncbi:hypothetical protein [Pseudonocardia spinosispora]|uniref:hypothetical protein n=1 Tax=Pseudonocardia spinosispora TaxID=103441 RepID=UPI00040A8468|nr:hypothetical protein [Pseudonocardia spinosispora]